MEKPTKCWGCSSTDFWQRSDGEWLCNRCHPNPNSNPGKEGHSPEVLALRDRIKLGNDKLFRAWLQIRELVEDREEWSRQMDRWNEAQDKLHGLCLELKAKGYVDCLYIENGKKMRRCLDNPDGFWCQVCPSLRPYWEEELMGLPSPKAPPKTSGALLSAELTAYRTRRLLDTRGWCLWKCSLLGGETVAVVKDEHVRGVPPGYPVYTEAELRKLSEDDVSEATLRLVHEAKKRAGAVVTD